MYDPIVLKIWSLLFFESGYGLDMQFIILFESGITKMKTYYILQNENLQNYLS